MKISIDVDLTPEEMRRLFGLPDFTPVQELLMDRITKQVESGLDGNLLPGLMRAAISGGMQSFEAYQKFVSNLLSAGSSSRASSAGGDSDAEPDADQPSAGRGKS